MKQLYPSWRYHPITPAQVVQNETADQQLPAGWRDRPYTADEITALEAAWQAEQRAASAAAPPPDASAPDEVAVPAKRRSGKRLGAE